MLTTWNFQLNLGNGHRNCSVNGHRLAQFCQWSQTPQAHNLWRSKNWTVYDSRVPSYSYSSFSVRESFVNHMLSLSCNEPLHVKKYWDSIALQLGKPRWAAYVSLYYHFLVMRFSFFSLLIFSDNKDVMNVRCFNIFTKIECKCQKFLLGNLASAVQA